MIGLALLAAAHPLVHVNAGLNSLATLLLIAGYVLIKRRAETAHRRVMLTAFGVSCAFLVCYLYYHFVIQLQTPFAQEGSIKYLYFAILISHVLLAMTVPFLAIATILFGIRAHAKLFPANVQQADSATRAQYALRNRHLHRKWARITFPIWLYVSVTGVIVYAMLYHWFPAA